MGSSVGDRLRWRCWRRRRLRRCRRRRRLWRSWRSRRRGSWRRGSWRRRCPRRHHDGRKVGKSRMAFGGWTAWASAFGTVGAEICKIALAVPPTARFKRLRLGIRAFSARTFLASGNAPAHVACHRTLFLLDHGDALLERSGVRVPAGGVFLAVSVRLDSGIAAGTVSNRSHWSGASGVGVRRRHQQQQQQRRTERAQHDVESGGDDAARAGASGC